MGPGEMSAPRMWGAQSRLVVRGVFQADLEVRSPHVGRFALRGWPCSIPPVRFLCPTPWASAEGPKAGETEERLASFPAHGGRLGEATMPRLACALRKPTGV